jgi:hypothetical protein
MTNAVFPTFLNSISNLDFSSASHSGTLGFAKHLNFPLEKVKDVASDRIKNDIWIPEINLI